MKNLDGINKDNWDAHWSDQDLLAKYNPGQNLRHQIVAKIIEGIDKKDSLVDFGSGQGDFIKLLSNTFTESEFYGIEFSEKGVEISKRNNTNATFIKDDLLDPTLPKRMGKLFNVITCCDVLEHVDNPITIINNAYDMLSKGGTLVITLPGGPMSKLDLHIGHRFHYNVKLLENLLKKSNFRSIDVKAVGWPFFNIYRLMLLIRGNKLVEDVSCSNILKVPLKIKFIGSIFKYLFKFNLNKINLGWQMVAIAKK
jgi:SAM-dependent methyltransferase